MKVLIVSGLIYLLGISIVLFFRPAIMFNDKGEWKEFGIGRDQSHFTPFPFWMFVFLWAISSYIIARLIFKLVDIFNTNATTVSINTNSNKRNIRKNSIIESPQEELFTDNISPSTDRKELIPGYYILNTTSLKRGSPKYIYYGKKPPVDIE